MLHCSESIGVLWLFDFVPVQTLLDLFILALVGFLVIDSDYTFAASDRWSHKVGDAPFREQVRQACALRAKFSFVVCDSTFDLLYDSVLHNVAIKRAMDLIQERD